MTQIWCNSQWLDPAEFPSSPFDRGAMHGLGLFETLLALDGRAIFVEKHLARLKRGCEQFGWQVPFPDLRPIIEELLIRNHLQTGRARVRISVTAGIGPIDDISIGTSPLLLLSATHAANPPRSLELNFSPWRKNEHSALAGLKCAAYAENLVALDHARRQGFNETIFLNNAGQVCEAATANIFMMKNGVLVTPSLDSGCLPGITRGVVLELAGRCRLSSEERSITQEELLSADEVFITSSLRGLASVSRIDGKSYHDISIAKRLRQYWDVEIDRH